MVLFLFVNCLIAGQLNRFLRLHICAAAFHKGDEVLDLGNLSGIGSPLKKTLQKFSVVRKTKKMLQYYKYRLIDNTVW